MWTSWRDGKRDQMREGNKRMKELKWTSKKEIQFEENNDWKKKDEEKIMYELVLIEKNEQKWKRYVNK